MKASSINTLNKQKKSLIFLFVKSEKMIKFFSFFAFQVGMPHFWLFFKFHLKKFSCIEKSRKKYLIFSLLQCCYFLKLKNSTKIDEKNAIKI